MTKKQLVKSYLEARVDFDGLFKTWSESWLSDKPHEWLTCNGIANSYFTYDLLCDAIEYAGYKYPKSDKTWLTAYDVKRELINAHVFK